MHKVCVYVQGLNLTQIICVKLRICKASLTSSDWIIQVLKLGSLYQYNAILRKCRVHKVCLLHRSYFLRLESGLDCSFFLLSRFLSFPVKGEMVGGSP